MVTTTKRFKMGGNQDNIFFDVAKLKSVGKNVIIGKTVRIRQPENVSIGDNTIIDDFTYISCAANIGKNCHIASNVSISGGKGKLNMGNYSTISNGSSLHCASSDYKKCSLELPSIAEEDRFGGEVGDIHIGDFVTVGAHSCVLPNSTLPIGSAYGAYTLIKGQNKLLPFTIYAGVNCNNLGTREGFEKYLKFMEKSDGK